MVSMKLVNRLISYLFPERDDAVVVRTAAPDLLALRAQRYTNESTIFLLPFSDPLVRAAIHEVKYHHNERAIALLQAVLARWLPALAPGYIVPIPLSAARLRKRGYNQVAVLVKPLVEETHHQYHPHILVRTINTTPQTRLPRQERLTNVANAFFVPKREQQSVTGQHIILIDDVSTTGATLKAARAALAPHSPARITCLAIAH